MRTKFLIALCSALTLCIDVHADDEHEARRGLFPYMAFIYYPDESVVDATGARFLRGAILIRPEWLVTSAVGPSVVADAPNSFPRKTLLARLGAITIDANFTLNEDEDEQEREVIEIVRPYNHSATQWWRTDISLMKVLLPFNLTTAVSIANLSPKHDLLEKTCIILVFAKREGNDTEDRTLMQLSVDMLPPSIENCGSHFSSSMTCATDSEDNKNTVYDTNFCQGNSGGPLICDNDVVGIQTYIDNDCKQPHLYQLLSAWDYFITCGTEDKCREEHCSHICDVSNKDPPLTNAIDKTKATSEKSTGMMMQALSSAPQTTPTRTETTTEEGNIVTTTPMMNLEPEEIPTTTTTTTETPLPTDTEPTTTETVAEVDTAETTHTWPNEKDPADPERRKLEQDMDNPDRKPNVEARHHKSQPRSAGSSNVSNTLSLFFGFFILACLI